jgi:putative aminopeptidase FrvX
MTGTRDTPLRALETALDALDRQLETLHPLVDELVTRERVWQAVAALAETPAPSSAATAFRGDVLRAVLGDRPAGIVLDLDHGRTGSAAVCVGAPAQAGRLWYFAHLDTISYLVDGGGFGRYGLVPYCYHLTTDGRRAAKAFRYDLSAGGYRVVGEGSLVSEGGAASFVVDGTDPGLGPGDRVVPVASCRIAADGSATGHFDNAGGVAAVLVAAVALAAAGEHATLFLPDEEEGPAGAGNQTIGRGGTRLVGHLAPPDLAIVSDMQQAAPPDAPGPRLGAGAVLSEYASLGRGSVTPPHLFAAAREWARRLAPRGVRIQEPAGSYTSRSDDVSAMLRTPNVLLMGFPGFDRHFDRAEPRAHPDDLVDLARSLVYASALRPLAALLRSGGPR